MINSVSTRLMTHFRNTLIFPSALALLMMAGFHATAADAPLGFTVYISGDPNVPTIEIENKSEVEITAFAMSSGNPNKHFDAYLPNTPSPGGTISVIQPIYRFSTVNLNIKGWDAGERISFRVDLDDGVWTSGRDTYEDYRDVFFNNGSLDNSLFVFHTKDGRQASFYLPDQSGDKRSSYKIRLGTPRQLYVKSVSEAAANNYVEKVIVKVNSDLWKIDANGAVEIGQEVAVHESIPVIHGDTIEIIAPREVYRDLAGNDIADSATPDPNGLADAQQRFTAIGISVNDVPQTADPTLFRFDITGDTAVVVKWRHDFALTVESDFAKTTSPEKVGTNFWAGPLASEAAGNPDPAVQKHWIKKDETVISQIDGQVLDFSRPGLDIRYVPASYIFNPLGFSVSTNQFSVGQSPPQRQQVSNIRMTNAISVKYLWKIQFGIKANVDDVSRTAVPRIFEFKNGTTNVFENEGTFWFDPDSHLQVASAAIDPAKTNKALSGWFNGDGYYFSSSGELQSDNGTLLQGGPAPGVLSTWIPELVYAGKSYRGFDIQQLKRPARVFWTYGNQQLRVAAKVGQYVFQEQPSLAATFTLQPDQITQKRIDWSNKTVADTDLTIWDPVASKLYPLIAGEFEAKWRPSASSSNQVDVIVTVTPPDRYYPHVANSPPVALDPDPGDNFIFKQLKYSENQASVDGDNFFRAEQAGKTVLLFSEIVRGGRGQPQEFLAVRVVDTKLYTEVLTTGGAAIIGQKVTDAALDKAKLETGYLVFDNVRYNPFIYDVSKLDGLAARDIYDMNELLSSARRKVVVNKDNLPGPIIPVNLFPTAAQTNRITVVWYDDPSINDQLLWPHRARSYIPRWPRNAGEGLGRITIASQYGSESQITNAATEIVDQVIMPATATTPEETTYNPSRFQATQIYQQADRSQPGYNPNEEHALVAPSLRFAAVSPRPQAIYALRNNDLNVTTSDANYTSDPYVLAQFFDAAVSEFKMRVYEVLKEDPSVPNYRFATRSRLVSSTPPRTLQMEPYVLMKAGEPVIPFYPLGEVIGAAPCPETFGTDLKPQSVYWEDHKGSSWAISGGENAWFTHSVFYRLAPDFWWPANKSGFTRDEKTSSSLRQNVAMVPQVGDCLSFLPSNVQLLLDTTPGIIAPSSSVAANQPTPILYKSDWPDNPPVLKAGETLTFSGGEFRADNPLLPTVNADGDIEFVETPGLPGVVAFATAEIVFDSLNPLATISGWRTNWTARVAQVLDARSVPMRMADFPPELAPATQRTRVKQGKYVFNELPASLQKRVLYDPLSGKLEVMGLLNDKEIGDRTLTASPPAVYVLEPNIITAEEEGKLAGLAPNNSKWQTAVADLAHLSRNPNLIDSNNSRITAPAAGDTTGNRVNLESFWSAYYTALGSLPPGTNFLPVGISEADTGYLVGLEPRVLRDSGGNVVKIADPAVPGLMRVVTDPTKGVPMRAFGPGLAVVPNPAFLDPKAGYPEISYITVVENNDPTLGGSPITPYVIKVDRRERYRGAIKTIASDNVFDENLVLRHQGDFGANADELFFEWWYRPDDGSLNVPPPDLLKPGQPNPWKLFPDPSGARGRGWFQITLKGNPNAPEALLADTWWFVRYRHQNDNVDGTDWNVPQTDASNTVVDDRVNFVWAGAGNSQPFEDFDADGIPDFRAQLAQGWIKRVLDAVNPYEARIRDFEGDNPDVRSSMISEFGARFEGPVALNPSKNVIENVGLIELYETILRRGRGLSIDLSRPVSTPAIANALQLASTRISDFYTILGNEAYVDAQDPTIGFGSDSVDYGSLAPAVFSFQNQMSSLIEEELGLLRGVDDYFARPVYNRLFWNFTKGEGEAAYAMNYNVSDITQDGFIDEDDALVLYPQGHGDAWGHYLIALRNQYELLKHPYFNWVSRSEFYNLMDIVIKVDFLDERKFAQTAAAKAKAGTEIVNLTYREKYVEDPTAQWQGYTDSNKDRSWGVQGWARRAGQGAYFDWVTANALLPSEHPNQNLEGIQKVDRQENADIAVISANLNAIQTTFDQANKGMNPLGVARDAVVFDIDPNFIEVGSGIQGEYHFDQIYGRAVKALENATAIWDNANETRNMLRQVANTEAEFRNDVFQEDLSYKNQLIKIFGKPYEGTIGPGKVFPAGYDGPDLLLYMYVDIRQIDDSTVPGPTTEFASFTGNTLTGGEIYDAFHNGTSYGEGSGGAPRGTLADFQNPFMPLYLSDDTRRLFAPTFVPDSGQTQASIDLRNKLYGVNYTDLSNPKVPLTNLVQFMPVTAAGYTFQAPRDWGQRVVVGEVQMAINQMLQQEAAIASAIGEWDGLQGNIVRTLRLINAKLDKAANVRLKNEIYSRIKVATLSIIKGFEAGIEIANDLGDTVESISLAGVQAVPDNLPTGGLAVSPGDALGTAEMAILIAGTATKGGISVGEAVFRGLKAAAEIVLDITDNELELFDQREEDALAAKEAFKELEDLVGDEPIKRIGVFKEIQALRELSDQYRVKVDEGIRLIDERAAYNKRVAAQTQRNRYQDMTFRVARNHALQTYRSALDLAARYVYLAAKAYDYETNLDPSDPGSPSGILGEIVRARGIGLFDGEPQMGKGGLSQALAWLKANYDVLRGQLGINNPQLETGKISLRTELFRILPTGSIQPTGANTNLQIASPGADSDTLWRQTLQNAWVDDLWKVPEFRYHCRPFASESDGDGNHQPQPGVVLRFGTEIMGGKNFFGRPLSGADHAYDSSRFATKIRAAGVWFSDYRSDDLINDLPEAPRIYLVPTGTDIMSIPSSANPNVVRLWNVVDQRIPVPLPATSADMDNAAWIPLLDSLNGRMGEPRKFSSFRAYHDGMDEVNDDELVFDSRLVGRSVWNTQWLLIIPGLTLNSDPEEGLRRFMDQVSDIKLVFETYGFSGG